MDTEGWTQGRAVGSGTGPDIARVVGTCFLKLKDESCPHGPDQQPDIARYTG